MVRRLGFLAALLWPALGMAAEPVDLARWAASWPTDYRVEGIKTEPTYRLVVVIERHDDVFALSGGGPAWVKPSQEAVGVGAKGDLVQVRCARGADCNGIPHPTGYLAGAAVLGAARAGKLTGTAVPVSYGSREVVCLPAELIGVAEPFLDPCLDRATGAVIAQRHRLSGQFDGPTLDADSIHVTLDPTPLPVAPAPLLSPRVSTSSLAMESKP